MDHVGNGAVLGLDEVHSRKHDHEVQLYAFDILALVATMALRIFSSSFIRLWGPSTGRAALP